jgi:dienelactone hydrolase
MLQCQSRWLFVAIVSVLWVLIPLPGNAQIARVELHPFQSTTLTDQEFLTGQKEGKPIVIAGELRIPRPGTDRLPTVVLLHGSGGVGGLIDDWAQWFNAMGVATFVIDSFTARGIVSTQNDQAQLGRLAMIIDAYRALALLAKHPRIDPEKIVLMGSSRGAQATLYASLTRFQRTHGPGGTTFAAYIAFYPDCRTTFLNDDDVSNKPIRVFHGLADDYNPVDACRSYVDRLRKAGKDAGLTEYAGAHHVFDGRAFQKPVTLPKAQTTRQCRLEEAADGRIINSQTKLTFTYNDPCIEYGPTLAYNAQAHSEAQRALTELMSAMRKPKQ